MLVKELIEILKKHPEEAQVLYNTDSCFEKVTEINVGSVYKVDYYYLQSEHNTDCEFGTNFQAIVIN